MTDGYFDDRVANSYDEAEADMFQPDVVTPTVDFLASLASDGSALELGVGTGRIALPLSERGVRVHGIDVSTAMVRQLRGKAGAERIAVTIGDFATARIDATFRLVYLVFNTIMNLTTQEEQVACFVNAANHLASGGHFVVEVGVPALRRLPPGETIRAFSLGSTHFGFDEYDVVTQRQVSYHYRLIDGRLDLLSIPFRYVWPSELDLMARLAGMNVTERWGSWTREPFTQESTQHVSVWQKSSPPHR